ncbi:hypothetical protein M9C81_06365 [SAR86 cluster bacterium]|nr:hypothetical protein M9C81_06365 [SAR86 cluster bacterium]
MNKIINSIEEDLIKWDSIGLHRTGTEGDDKTAYWLADEINKCGLTAEIDSFHFIKRTPGRCEVSNGTHTAIGLPMFDGGSTSSNGIKGLHGSLNIDDVIAITQYSSSANDESSINLNEARKKNKHPAIIAIAEVYPNIPGLAVLNAESYRKPFGPPVLQVATQEGEWLMRLKADEKISVSVELFDEKSDAINVQTKIVGKNQSLSPLVVMTPKSGWWTCTSERGGGITIWLNAMRYLSKIQPNRSVIFTANTGHELSHLGLDHFLKKNPSLVKNAFNWVHLGANFAAKGGHVLWQASTKEYIEKGLGQLEDLNFDEISSWPISSRPLGEARNIYDGGGQFISLLGSNPLFHHPKDIWPDSIDIEKLIKLNSFMMNMIIDLANSKN